MRRPIMQCWRRWVRFGQIVTLVLFTIALSDTTLASDSVDSTVPEPVIYSRDIKPIFSNRCYACHGPDEQQREAELRLDDRRVATEGAIVPGDAASSPLLERIASKEADERMPPADSKKSRLTQEEIELVRRWIDEGAKFDTHWAYTPLVRPDVPDVDSSNNWPRGAIDRFIAARHARHRAEPSPEADRRTLIRRLSFDLIGLTPAAEEIDAFIADRSADAYECLVDRLLASPHYGERMAMVWLDLVRYADTNGLHSDNHRDVYLYRDYVISVFNENVPFDRFTIEQLAGDLLEGSSQRQKVASGYNRMNMTTREGGAQPKEYRAKYAADRVRNVSGVWLGSTMGCCECHDHKFDPFTMRDFYSLAAFFADLEETAVGVQRPTPIPTTEQTAELARFDERIAAATEQYQSRTAELTAAKEQWERQLKQRTNEWTVLRPHAAESAEGATLEILEDGSVRVSGNNPDRDTYVLDITATLDGVTAIRLEVLPDDALPRRGPGRANNGNFVLTEFVVSTGEDQVPWSAATASHSQDGWSVDAAVDGKPETGWAILNQTGKANTAVFETKENLVTDADTSVSITLQFNHGTRHTLGRFRLSTTTAGRPVRAPGADGLPPEVAGILDIASEDRSPDQENKVWEHFRKVAKELQPQRNELAALRKKRDVVNKSIPTSLVSKAIEPRVMRVLPRGNWLDDSGEIVQPAVPAHLGQVDVGDRRANRLDLAHWLVQDDNPLVARVMVNRLWKLAFGAGIIRSPDDYGSQGQWPTHPELLDWLARDFIESGWDVKHTLRLIVTSSTYRQSSQVTGGQRQTDPANRLLARQGRFRLPAEMVRDNALSIGNLLVRTVGGPSVKPYQPAGYWAHLNFPVRTYQHDHGANQYRRGLYTYWARMFLHPSLLAFDAPSREECSVKRPRSNTPLQALVLLNDPTYVEAARVLATRAIREAGDAPRQRIEFYFRHALGRTPREEEMGVLLDLAQRHLARYAEDSQAAAAALTSGETPPPEDIEPAELAAWTSVARVVLNLHETITRY